MCTDMRLTERDGFALPATLLAMFVIGAIVTGGFYVSSQEHNVSLSTELGAQALQAAEYGLEEQVSGWTNAHLDGLPPATVSTFGPFPVTNGARQVGAYTIRVAPLGGRTYLVQSEGELNRGNRTARRRMAKLVRTYQSQLPYNTAMTVFGELAAGGNALISGEDQCSADEVPGVMAVDTSLVSGVAKNQHEDRIVGDPAVDDDPNMEDVLAEFDFDALGAAATHHYEGNENPSGMGPVTIDEDGQEICDKSDPNNWGEPYNTMHPCADYYPVISVDGDFKLTTGIGQGILIVDGDLEIAGNIEFSGIVIVKGSFKMTGTGSGTGKINGTVISQGSGEIDTDNMTSGNAQVQYNSCKIEEAFNAGMRVRPFNERAWIVDASSL